MDKWQGKGDGGGVDSPHSALWATIRNFLFLLRLQEASLDMGKGQGDVTLSVLERVTPAAVGWTEATQGWLWECPFRRHAVVWDGDGPSWD